MKKIFQIVLMIVLIMPMMFFVTGCGSHDEDEITPCNYFWRLDFGGGLHNFPIQSYIPDNQPVDDFNYLVLTHTNTEQIQALFSETYSVSLFENDELPWVRDERFTDLINSFDEEFFENYFLTTFVVTAAGGAYRFRVSDITMAVTEDVPPSNSEFFIDIEHYSAYGIGHDALVNWFGIVPLPRVTPSFSVSINLVNRGW